MYPIAIAIDRPSTTWTGIGIWAAASRAASHVWDSFSEMWIDTIISAPAAMASWYAQKNAGGAGGAVETGTLRSSASQDLPRRQPVLVEAAVADVDGQRHDDDAEALRQLGRDGRSGVRDDRNSSRHGYRE